MCASTGPRRMSERDLPSRLGHDSTPQQIHSSKSVPALHSKLTIFNFRFIIFHRRFMHNSISTCYFPLLSVLLFRCACSENEKVPKN